MKLFRLPAHSKYILSAPYYFETGIELAKSIRYTMFNIIMGREGTLVLGIGFHFDGASGPAPDWGFHRASAIHDALYILMRDGLLDKKWRNRADEIMRDVMIEDGLPKWYANIAYQAVKTFGAGALNHKLKAVK